MGGARRFVSFFISPRRGETVSGSERSEGARALGDTLQTFMSQRPQKLIERARSMRRKPSPGERALWSQLCGRGGGIAFRRQHPIGHYIVDFACLKAKIVIEIDGVWFHMDRGDYDAVRSQHLESEGFLVLRYDHSDVVERAIEIGSDIFELCQRRIEGS